MPDKWSTDSAFAASGTHGLKRCDKKESGMVLSNGTHGPHTEFLGSMAFKLRRVTGPCQHAPRPVVYFFVVYISHVVRPSACIFKVLYLAGFD